MYDDTKKISKADIILLAAIILLCLIVLACFYILKKPGLTADILISGATVDTVQLDDTAAYIVDAKSSSVIRCERDEVEDYLSTSSDIDSYNVVIIEDNSVNVIDADCPDKVCVNHSNIENVGETIICLPHKLVVEIKEN